MASVAVIGGGITGLTAAYRVAQRGHRVVLIEASDRLGGKILTTPFAGLPAVDAGPDAFLARVPWALELCRELGLDDDLVSPAVSKAYVYWNHQLHPIPDGLVLGVPAGLGRLARSGLLSWRGKLRAGLEPVLPANGPARVDDNLGRLITARFGREVLERLVDPLLGGINAGDADRLSLSACAPQIEEAARGHRSLLLSLRRAAPPRDPSRPIFLTPRAGLGSLVDRLVAASAGLGVDLRTGCPATSLEPVDGRWLVEPIGPVDAVVLATPASSAAGLLGSAAPEAARLLSGIDYASVAMVTLAYPADAISRPMDASGHLVPKPQQRAVTAVSWASTKWAHWARPEQLIVRASLGRHGDESILARDDAGLVEAACGDLAEQLGLRGAPSDARVTRWDRSFPQYEPHHLDRVTAITAELAERAPGVFATGAAYRGVGIPACIRQGSQAAADVDAFVGRA